MKKKRGENKLIVLFQLVVLIISLFAFCWMINSEIKFVNAEDGDSPTGGTGKGNAWDVIVGASGFGLSILGKGGIAGPGLAGSLGLGSSGASAGADLGGGLSGIGSSVGSILGGVINALAMAYAAASLYKTIFALFASQRNMDSIFNDWIFYGSILAAALVAVIIGLAAELGSGPVG